MKYLLLLDYDGTLTPIRKRPAEAHFSPSRKIFLRKLSNHSKIKIAIISGRKLSDIKRRIGIPGLIYVGNHGFEVEVSGKRYVHPAVQGFIPTLRRVKAALIKAIKIKGVFLEDKELTLSVHYRLATDKDMDALRRIFRSTLRPFTRKVRITAGKKVTEIRPPVDWDKGKAVKWIINNLRPKDYTPIYIGDDETDEDAFKILKGKGVALAVGKRKNTAAIACLKNVSQVYQFLKGLVKP